MAARTVFLQALATLALVACDNPRPLPHTSATQAAPPPPNDLPTRTSAPVPPAAPPLPPGVLALVPGKTGLVRVEESGPFRLLTIDGVIHAAHLNDSANASLAPFDPLVELLSETRLSARGRALVVGLGSGATSTALGSTGYTVEVAEIDPTVIDVARRYFDYQGHAEAIDGLDYLRREGKPYDIILVDAFSGTNLAESFVTPDAATSIRKRLAREGLVAVRLLGAPRDPTVLAAMRTLSDAFPHKRLFGTGTGDELQNLYLLLSDEPLRLFDLNVGPVFPLPWPDATGASTEPASEALRRDLIVGKQPRRVVLMGYLVRGEDGTLCIDLPHWEMGARRYILRGPAVESFKKLVPAKFTFPTQGDLSTDGEVSKTLHSLLGGGGVKLSTVRFSPVVVAVEGALLPTSEVSADRVTIPRSPPRNGEMREPFDTRAFMTKIRGITGNALGEVAVERVHFTLDHRQWQDFRQKTLRPIALRAVKSLAEGNFDDGRAAIDGILAAFDAKFGRLAPRMVTYDEFLTLRDVLRSFVQRNQGSEMVSTGVDCDRVRHRYRTKYGGPFWGTDNGTERREMGSMLAALYECAVRHFEKTAGKKPESPEARAQAARLVGLLGDPGWDEFDDKKRGAFEKRAEKLSEQWGIEGSDEPL